jgi:hypothetical protein
VDVDVDIDVDIDVDAIAVVDVDIDVDIDVDTDVDNVVDTVDVTDVDVDIDTDVDVDTGMVRGFVNKIGNWIVTKGFPALVENLQIMIVFQTAGVLLNAWKDKSEEYLNSLAPQQSTGIGLLINYMLNEKNGIDTRWNTFGDYVQQGDIDIGSQQMNMSTILMTKNDAADNAQKAWRWPTADQHDLVNKMSAFTAADQYKAYGVLASYTYGGKPLPVKVGAATAIKYLTKIA